LNWDYFNAKARHKAILKITCQPHNLVDVKIFIANGQFVLLTHEGKSCAQFQQELANIFR
jgi:hypothetical protein